MMARGDWRAEAEFNGIAGFHISELYSPWVKWGDMVSSFYKAKRLPETLKVWVNTSLGETWKDRTEGVDPNSLLKRKENWGRVLPSGVIVVTVGVDVQGDRLEAEVVGWGFDQESWSLQYHILHGNPSEDKVWNDLDHVLRQSLKTEDGRVLLISGACVDSGGHHTQKVYEYTKAREYQRVYAIKGASQIGKPLVSKFSKNNKLRAKLFTLGTDTAKQMIYARLKIHTPGAGYCHFPADCTEEYFKQLTSERIQTKFVNGHPTRVWIIPKGRRNEALDCRVYALASYHILNPNMEALLKDQEREKMNQKSDTPSKNKASDWIGCDDWNFS